MATWADLDAELDAWSAAGLKATFWWRDDDATGATPALERLVRIAADTDTPISLAVIPKDADGSLAALVARSSRVTVLQHGYAHFNHAPGVRTMVELGGGRPFGDMVEDITIGRALLSRLIPSAAAVMVPPWNRIDERLVAALPEAGFAGLSRWGPRTGAGGNTGGLAEVNTHCDIVRWVVSPAAIYLGKALNRGLGRVGANPLGSSRGFIGLDGALGQIVDHLVARRTGAVDATEPTGLLSHHQAHDGACWSFITQLLTRTTAHPAGRWLSAEEAFDRP